MNTHLRCVKLLQSVVTAIQRVMVHEQTVKLIAFVTYVRTMVLIEENDRDHGRRDAPESEYVTYLKPDS